MFTNINFTVFVEVAPRGNRAVITVIWDGSGCFTAALMSCIDFPSPMTAGIGSRIVCEA
jgi:hypothetical protein